MRHCQQPPLRCERPEGPSMPPRFVPPGDIAGMLAISAPQAYALVRSGELRAIKIGGRGQWRVGTTQIESYIQRSYRATASYLEEERPQERAKARGDSRRHRLRPGPCGPPTGPRSPTRPTPGD